MNSDNPDRRASLWRRRSRFQEAIVSAEARRLAGILREYRPPPGDKLARLERPVRRQVGVKRGMDAGVQADEIVSLGLGFYELPTTPSEASRRRRRHDGGPPAGAGSRV